MASGRSCFSFFELATILSKLIFLSYFCLICATGSTVFTAEADDKQTDDGATLSTTFSQSVSIEDTLLAGSIYEKQASTLSISDVNKNEMLGTIDRPTKTQYEPESNVDRTYSNVNTDNDVGMKIPSEDEAQKTGIESQNLTNTTNINSTNISESATNSTNKTVQPFWSCVKYNISQQSVIILKDKSSLIWWLDELNKTMGCAVVLFYAKWCYFSASLAPKYNAIGRAFSGIPVLAIDAYTHNSFNTRYGIVGVPSIVLFQESRPVSRFNRSRTYKDLVEFIHQSTGMEYNSSVEVSPIDYEEGPLVSTPSEEFNFYLFAAVVFLICITVLVLWRLNYVKTFVECFTSLSLIRTLLARPVAREKNE